VVAGVNFHVSDDANTGRRRGLQDRRGAAGIGLSARRPRSDTAQSARGASNEPSHRVGKIQNRLMSAAKTI
jgi:hypothetical protein